MNVLPKGYYEAEGRKRTRICVICLEKYKDKDDITFLPCDPRHHFHSNCIEMWLLNHAKCPVCNIEITMEAAKSCKRYVELVDFVKQKDEESFELEKYRSNSLD